MSDRSGLLITLPARPENVSIVRHVVAGVAERLGMGETGVGDLKTTVTEACMNAALHAYDDDTGPLQVEVLPERRKITVRVRDFGTGIRPHAELERPSLRLGLTLIAALSESFEIASAQGGGTEITMHMAVQ